MTHPRHMTAAQSLEWFCAHRVVGAVIPTRHRRQQLREYTVDAVCLDGVVRPAAHRILALPSQHVSF
jgi:hypothetical protein